METFLSLPLSLMRLNILENNRDVIIFLVHFIKLETILTQRKIFLLFTIIPIATEVSIVYVYKHFSKEYNNISLRHIINIYTVNIFDVFDIFLHLYIFLFYAFTYVQENIMPLLKKKNLKNYRLILIIQTFHSIIFLSIPYSTLYTDNVASGSQICR